MSRWIHQFADAAKRQFRKLDRPVQAAILEALDRLVFEQSNPREPKVSNLKAMHGKHAGRWRLRVGDHRVIFRREGDRLVILVLAVGNRRDVYRD